MNGIKYIISLFIMSSVLFNSAEAQESWDLKRCIDFATSHNIDVQRSVIEIESEEILKDQAFKNRLPAINGSVSNTQSWGRSTNEQNDFINTIKNITSLGVDGNMTLFNGFKLDNSEKKKELDLKAAKLNKAIIEDNISLEVANTFISVVYYKELEIMYQIQVDIIQKQLDKANVKYEAGALAKESVLEIKTELSRQKSGYVEMQSSYLTTLNSLKQKMNCDPNLDLRIEASETPEVNADISLQAAEEIYGQALPHRPEIKWADLQVESSEMALKVAKADYYPSLNLLAGYSNSYDDNYPFKLEDQLINNEAKYVRLSLSVPIFNRHSARNNVKLAKLNIENQQKLLEQKKKELREQIQNAWMRAVNAREKFISKKTVFEEQKEVYNFAKERFDLGAIAAMDLNIQMDRMQAAEIDMLQMKYEFIFSTKVLEFYAGIPLQL